MTGPRVIPISAAPSKRDNAEGYYARLEMSLGDAVDNHPVEDQLMVLSAMLAVAIDLLAQSEGNS